MRSFTALPTCKSPVALHLDCALICQNNIVERTTEEVLLGPIKSFHLICFLNQLAVGATAKSPSKSRSASKDRPKGDQVAFLRQEMVKLISCRFVVSSHLLLHYLLDFSCDLLWSSRTNPSSYQTSFSVLLQKLIDANPGTL